MTPAEYLKKPFARQIVPEPDGSFRGEIVEFPGCIALGDTPVEALTNLERVAAGWLEATIAKGQQVPEPTPRNKTTVIPDYVIEQLKYLEAELMRLNNIASKFLDH